MEIIACRPGRPGDRVRAFLDVRFDNGLLIRGLRVTQTQSGLRVFGPTIGDQSVVALTPAVADALIKAVPHVAA